MNYSYPDPAQQRAITHKDGPMLVLAGPGSGKTHTITQRLLYLLREARLAPEEILVISFTRAAAGELQERFEQLYGMPSGITFGTFHAVFFHILQSMYHYRHSDILTETQKAAYLRSALDTLSLPGEAEDIPYLLQRISRVKNAGLDPRTLPPEDASLSARDFAALCDAYTALLREERKLDFDDMVLQCRELFRTQPDILSLWQRRYRYLLIDEFQDINTMQYEVVRMLAAPEDNLFVVGDDDQSIYGFRGACPELMLRFPRDYPQAARVTLSKNYRSTQGIVDTALRLVSHSRHRYPKRLHAVRGQAQDVRLLACDDAEAECELLLRSITDAARRIPYRDMAILFRTNAQARRCSRALAHAGIPFYLREALDDLHRSPIGLDIAAMLAFSQGERTRAHLLRFLNKPSRFLSRALLPEGEQELRRLARTPGLPPYAVRALERLAYDMEQLGSMHPYAAISYIRRAMGYEEYLVREAREHKQDPADALAMLELLSDSARAVSSYAEWRKDCSAYGDALRQAHHAADEDAVQLLTMHAAKGLEYRFVMIPGLNEGCIPQKKALRPEEIEEERRILYVAMTRARDKLLLLYQKKNPEKKQRPSRFLRELGIPGARL